MPAPLKAPLRLKPTATVWDYLALSDDELEKADVVALDMAVAREIPQLKNLEMERYLHLVDAWTAEFARRLPSSEAFFWNKGPQIWKSDIRFYRVGMLQSYLAHTIGIRYIEEQRNVKTIAYTNAPDLFLCGLIDTRRGTCGNMATLHVAMARRMGWPVALACVKNHHISRFDDGEVIHNIECAYNENCDFSAGSDADYIKKFNLPKKAIECGSDLRKLTAREMIAVFLAHRARHYRDIGKHNLCDVDCSLSRALFPNYRQTIKLGMAPFMARGEQLFNRDEHGHPDTIGDAAEFVARETAPPPLTNIQPAGGISTGVTMIMRPAPNRGAPVPSKRQTFTIPMTATFKGSF